MTNNVLSLRFSEFLKLAPKCQFRRIFVRPNTLSSPCWPLPLENSCRVQCPLPKQIPCHFCQAGITYALCHVSRQITSGFYDWICPQSRLPGLTIEFLRIKFRILTPFITIAVMFTACVLLLDDHHIVHSVRGQ